ncbi:MAG: hypothetical protein Q8R05_00650 [Candidatus Omnitrophota bacterium]|nr:hypothetical protein [Candidatus Omnitrophota bacterium]
MKKFWIIWAIAALSIFGWIRGGLASEGKVDYSVEPFFRYSIVDGDKEKFREDMWIKNKAAGGIQEFSFSQDSKGMKVDAEGRAIVNEDDYKFDINLEKEDLFKIASGFKEFRKYYDGTGGFYSLFPVQKSVESYRGALWLNDSHFFINLSTKRPDEPNYFVNYERHDKSGTMSTLRWNSVVEAISGVYTTRKIAPSWKELDETQHTINVGAEGDTKIIKDIHWKVEEKLLYFKEESKNVERRWGINYLPTASQNAIDVQDERPRSRSSITTLLADSHINDWLYVSTATQYEHTRTSVLEDLGEINSITGDETNYTANTENYFDSTASNTLDKYSWAGTLFMNPLKYLTTSAKIKAELKKRFSNSTYPRDMTALADYRIDQITKSDTSSDWRTLGESLGVRFTKLPRTVLYIDGDFEQIGGRIKEERMNWVNAADTFSRDTDFTYLKNSITAGVNWRPYNFLSVSSRYRKIFNEDDYDDRAETRPDPTRAYSAFIDEQQFQGDNLTTKVDIKPYKWIHGLFKYVLKNSNIYTRPENQDKSKTVNDTSTYLGSVTLIPTQNFYLTGMFSIQDSFTDTVAAQLVSEAVIPRYEAGVNTAMGSATYIINSKASLGAQYQWVRSNNFNDFSSWGMPYGIDNTWHRLWLTFKYDVKEDLSTEIIYGFTDYNEESNNGIDDYRANIIGGKLAYTF